MVLTRRSALVGSLAVVVPSATRAAAPSLAKPKGEVILTVLGKIGAFNDGNKAEFDLAMLESYGAASFTTWTPWYNNPQTFSGLPMAKLMQVVRAHGTSVVATALNDYQTRIPISDFVKFRVLLAIKRNGKNMPISDKGRLFIVYPYDSNPLLKSQKYYSRSSWQLDRLDVV